MGKLKKPFIVSLTEKGWLSGYSPVENMIVFTISQDCFPCTHNLEYPGKLSMSTGAKLFHLTGGLGLML